MQSVPQKMNTPVEGSETSVDRIQLSWSALTTLIETGNTFLISSYNVQIYNSATEVWDEVIGESSPFTDLTHTMTDGLVMGTEYRLRIRAENIHGFGEFSDEVVIRVDDKPGVPSSVTTTANGLNVDFNWSAPASDNGSPITLYKLLLESETGSMVEVTDCVPPQPRTSCSIAFSELIENPQYNLKQNDEIRAQVTAFNVNGWSQLSTITSNGALVQVAPH